MIELLFNSYNLFHIHLDICELIENIFGIY